MHSHIHLNLKILWDKNLTFSLEDNETEPEGKFPAQGHKATMTFKSKPSQQPAPLAVEDQMCAQRSSG